MEGNGEMLSPKLFFLLRLAPQGNQRETQRMEDVEVALIFIPSSCLYLRKIPLTTLKWKSVMCRCVCVSICEGHSLKDAAGRGAKEDVGAEFLW